MATTFCRERQLSAAAYSELCEHIPGGVNSPVRAFPGLDQTPLVVASGKGDLLFDVDGHSYIDFCCSWGALIHGHAHPEVLQAVREQLARGISYGATTQIEGRLAAKISEMIPSIEQIRFVSSGTEATMSAARLARGATGRKLIIKFVGNYHGHADLFLTQAGSGVAEWTTSASSDGVPEAAVQSTLCLPYNDCDAIGDAFERFGDRIAAVIVEPVAGNMGCIPATRPFLHLLRRKTQDVGALLIFDEVITGFRVAKGGAQELYGVDPDLTCLFKVPGGGFQAAAFGGKREIMQHLAPCGSVYQAGTLAGNPIAMASGIATLELLDRPGFYEELDRKVDLLVKPIEVFLSEHQIPACIQRVGSMFTLFLGATSVSNFADAQALDHDAFKGLFRFLFDRGIYIPPSQYESWFLSSAHTDGHIEEACKVILEYLHSVVE